MLSHSLTGSRDTIWAGSAGTGLQLRLPKSYLAQEVVVPNHGYLILITGISAVPTTSPQNIHYGPP
jgi:hypothetical protein